MIPLAKFAMLRAAAKKNTIAFFNSAVSNAQTVTMPASILANDIAILFDAASTAGVNPSSVTPSGWSAIGASQGGSIGGGLNARFNMSYKVLVGSESGSSITGMNGSNNNAKGLLVFRPSAGVWQAPSSVAHVIGSSTPSNQTVTAGAAPGIVLGCAADNLNGSVNLGMSPAATASIADAFDIIKAGYIIYNSGPSNNTVSSTEPAGALGSFFLALI